MDLAAVIAPNGLGHFRRVIRELDALVGEYPKLKTGLICQTWQLHAMEGWAPLQRLLASGTTLATDALDDTFRWAASSVEYNERNLIGWVDGLRLIDWLKSAKRVLSDNLTGVLEVRPDAVLGGSFLWSDVLETFSASSGPVRNFVERERQLLRTHQPRMLCVGDLAMAGVLERTRAVKMPWLCEWSVDRSPSAVPSPNVGVLGGATDTARDRMEHLVRLLLTDETLLIQVEQGLKTRFAAEPRVAVFEHDRDAYRALSLAFVRPGAGTLTDCIGGEVPMILLDEPGNPEMAHNARAVRALGIGEILAAGEDPTALEVARDNLAVGRWRSTVEGFTKLQRNGLRRTVDWLANWVGA